MVKIVVLLTLCQRLACKEMHPRNLYNQKPDFGELAKFRPSLKPFLIRKSKSPAKQQQQGKNETSTTPPSHLELPTCNYPSSQETGQETLPSVVVKPLSESPLVTDSSAVQQRFTKENFAYTLDFSQPAALRELTCAVLEKDFGLKVEIPLDMLIPAVPQRLNYVLWIEDLLSCAREGSASGSGRGVVSGDSTNVATVPKGETIIGIDIGM